MIHTLPTLPYPQDALAPHLSSETLEYHWGKHHRAYVDKLNGLIEGTPFADMSLEDLLKRSSGTILNNAAQHMNHSLYWQSLSPRGGGEPIGPLAEAIRNRYGSFEECRAAFSQQANSHFGSGWAWLALKSDNTVQIELTHDAGCPVAWGDVPLIACDLWEHAYYIDYRNLRLRYLESFWSMANWRSAEEIFQKHLVARRIPATPTFESTVF
jgi:Fe-Mn family superoxide dismutase